VSSKAITGGIVTNPTPMKERFEMHAHSTYEILYFISGDADYAVEGDVYSLKSGDIMLMRKSESHYLKLRSNAVYSRGVINFDPGIFSSVDEEGRMLSIFKDRPLGMYNHYPAELFPDNKWGYYFERICSCCKFWEKKIFLSALLCELSSCYERIVSETKLPEQSVASHLSDYINTHLFDTLSLEKLSSEFFLSRSQLNRIFKKDMGTTLYNYILLKRLFHSQKLLRDGVNPNQVSSDCGFNDYVSFYKAYKRLFNTSPKADFIKK